LKVKTEEGIETEGVQDQEESKDADNKAKDGPREEPEEFEDAQEEMEAEEIHEVESIKDKKKIKGVLSYRVKWKGYPKKKDWTWETSRTLMADVPDMVKAYEKKAKA
jgi:hypothetical protein